MSRRCEISNKRYNNANRVSHSNRKSKMVQNPNIQRVRVRTDKGNVVRMRICTRCIRSGCVKKA